MTSLIAMPALVPESGTLPELPALTRLLHMARRLPGGRDWREGVLVAAGAGAAPLPAVAWAAGGLATSPGGELCFATPLHVVAGISRVHLPPGGCLAFDADERAGWAEAFRQALGGPRWQLLEVGGHWLLAGAGAAAARDPDPWPLAGEALARAPAGSDPERALRRLGAEAEMWLAAHPLNAARAARGQPAFNSLWFWGGGQGAPLPALSLPQAGVWCAGAADAWLTGLAAHARVPLHLGAPGWHALPAPDAALVVLSPAGGQHGTDWWLAAEQQWFAPALAALEAGTLRALQLVMHGACWQLPASPLTRWLRRRRPWHEQVRQ